jgi:hypothetical protein
MKKLAYILSAIVMVVVFGCQDFEEIEKNPNQSTSVPASLVLTGVQYDMIVEPFDASKDHYWNQFWCVNYGYYGNNEYSWTNADLSFLTLKNVVKMEEEALKSGADAVNPYSALGKFFRAFFYVKMTRQVGDLPLMDALEGLDNTAPAYSNQKDIYKQVFVWLEEANSELEQLQTAGNTLLAGDLFFGNDLGKWRQVVNSFRLRVLISLSKKEASDADLNIKSQFAQIIGNASKYPLMAGNDDNLDITYNGTTTLYPTNPGNRGFDKGRYNMSETYTKLLTTLKDPRVFVVANPAIAKIDAGVAFDDFDAFVGANSAESLDDMTFKAGNGEYSYVNQQRYYTTLAGPEPALIMSYAEQCFNIAEGINRGWATGSAATYYVEGIKASMAYYDIADGSALTVTGPDFEVFGSVTVSVSDYLAQTSVVYAGDNAAGLEQILNQKYIAFFQNSGLEAFFNYRRTGVPAFAVGVGTGNGGVIPKRWLYPNAEVTTNLENLNQALVSQFGSATDDKNNDIWLTK